MRNILITLSQFKELIRSLILETYDEFIFPYYIIVITDDKSCPKLGGLNEGRWEPSSEKGL